MINEDIKTLLSNKKIVFIAPIFYDYHLMIKEKMEYFGAHVFFFHEPKYDIFFSLSVRLGRKYFSYYLLKHYNKILNNIKSIIAIDYLFVIRGYGMPDFFMEKIKIDNPEIKKIMYQWDSQNNNPYVHLKKYFDKLFTFDYKDSQQYDIKYLPLFYTDDVAKVRNHNEEKIYEYFFLATYSYERYSMLLKIINNEKNKNVKYKFMLFIKKRKYIKEYFNGIKLDKNLLIYKAVDRNTYLKYLMQSRCIIDLSHSSQTGLPMRDIEAIGALVKVLSTNDNLVKEFQNKLPIGILDNEFELKDPELNDQLNWNMSLVEEYSLETWLKKIFCNVKG